MKIDTPAIIHIKNLRLRAYIGIKDEEINNLQDLLINIEIQYDANAAISENKIEDALNYRTINKEIIRLVDQQSYALLEKLTHDVLQLIMQHDQVLFAQVEVDKPNALRFTDSVSITLQARRS